jgi:hypothetical protein
MTKVAWAQLAKRSNDNPLTECKTSQYTGGFGAGGTRRDAGRVCTLCRRYVSISLRTEPN